MNADLQQAASAAAKRLDQINTAEVQARLAEMDTEIASHDTAIQRARADAMALSRQIHERRLGPDPDQAADALLEGADITTAVPSADALQGERNAIEAGRQELDRRRDAIVSARSDLRTNMVTQLAEAAQPLATALSSEATRIATELADVYANAVAASSLTGSNEIETLALNLRFAIGELEVVGIIPREPFIPDHEISALASSPAVRVAGRGAPVEVMIPNRRLFLNLKPKEDAEG